MTYRDLYTRLIPSLKGNNTSFSLCDSNDSAEKEAKAIVRMLLEDGFNMSWTDVICGKVSELSREEALSLEEFMQRLEKGEPIQYVLGKAFFKGRPFAVAPGVLIPRPETAELCQWIEEENSNGKVLDVGTGSGCIAITIALDVASSDVTAWDISDDALLIAAENAKQLGAKVNFVKQDALNVNDAENCRWNVIVSNPPYIIEDEKKEMEHNVLDYEPELALFVPSDDALLFYRAIAEYGTRTLTEGGKLYFEINPLFAEEMKGMLEKMNYKQIEFKKDQFGKERMVRCIL